MARSFGAQVGTPHPGGLMHTTPGIHATQSIQDDVYTQWVKDPEGFWAEAGEAIHWYQRWNRVLDGSRPPFYRWFPGAEVNTCYNALDWHVEHGRADQPALIYDSPVTGTIKHFTYRELRDEVARFAGALAGLGVGKGDRVIIYMPMVPEAVVAMLACARIGAIHSVVFGGFASHELAARISHARPNVIVSASCGIEVNRIVPYKPLLDKAIELAEVKPRRCIILQRPQQQAPMIPGRDVDWAELTAAAQPAACVPVAATDPLYILYTSGTTGMPKGVVRDNGGHQARRSHRRARPALRPERLPHFFPRWRALRPGHAALGGAAARRSGDRPLVADGDRLAHRGELRRAGDAAGEAGLLRQGGRGL